MANNPNFQIPWGAIYAGVINEKEGRAMPEERGPLLFGRSTTPWKLLSVMVSQTRYWACSSAQFTIVRPILSEADKVLKLNTTNPAGLNYFDLRPEDPIIIELGYANSLFSDVPNEATRKRVFFGYVDTIKVTANSRGVKVVVSCRDSMRFLIDNKFSGSIVSYGQNGKNGKLEAKAGFYDTGVDSENIINLDPKKVTRALQGLDSEVVAGSEGNYFTTDDAQYSIEIGTMDKHKVMAWLIYAGSNGACLPAPLVENENTFNSNSGKFTTGKDPNLDDPGFERSTRPIVNPGAALEIVSGFNVMNKFPLEVIKHLGALESEPRELYADIDTGRICWKRKRTYNKEFNERRVYTFLLPARNGAVKPNIIASEIDWSTAGAISEVVAINPQADVQGSGNEVNKSSGVVTVIGRLPDNRFYRNVIPYAFPGLKNFVRRTRFIFDDTISSTDTANAEGLVEAFLRIWGKDIRSGTITIPGDSSIRPGYAVELHNIGIFDATPTLAQSENIGDPEYYRIEAVTHKMTAAGPNKGYRTLVAFAEADETRAKLIEKVYSELGNGNISTGKDNTFFSLGKKAESKYDAPRVSTDDTDTATGGATGSGR